MNILSHPFPCLRCLFLMGMLLGIGQSVEGQRLDFPDGRTAKVNHHDTPDACMAYIWWNRVQWDSLWQEDYTYSVHGRLLTNNHDDYYTGQGLLPHYNHTHAYDGAGRPIEHVQQVWSSGAYQNNTRETWTYDLDGMDSLAFNYEWVNTPFGFAWDTMSGTRTIYTYTPTNAIATTEKSTWTTTTSGSYWTDYSKVEYHYSPALEWDTVTNYTSMFGTWVESNRKVNMNWYDYSQGQCASYILQLPSGGWSDFQRVTCTFNGRDSDCTTETYSGGWDSTGRQYVTYDSIGHLTKDENWIRQSNQWSIQSGKLYFHTYDSQGRLVEKIDQNWDPLMGYLNTNKYVYGSFFVGMAASQFLPLELRAYPNPCTDQLKFSLSARPGPVTISLYDMQGKLRLQCQQAYNGAEIVVPISSYLPQGAYLYHVSTREGMAQGRVVLQR